MENKIYAAPSPQYVRKVIQYAIISFGSKWSLPLATMFLAFSFRWDYVETIETELGSIHTCEILYSDRLNHF